MGNGNQQVLFHESFNDALRYVVAALGGSKAVGQMLRPMDDIEKSSRWVSDCLNDERRERFSRADEFAIIRAGKDAGLHDVMRFWVTELGYTMPQPITRDDAKSQLQQEVVAAVGNLRALTAKLERLGALD